MKRPWLMIALLLSVGVNIGVLATLGVARARGSRPSHGEYERFERPDREPGRMMERTVRMLELDGEARDLFVAQHQRFFEQLQGTQSEMRRTRHELRSEVGAEAPDRQRIDELLTESARLQAELDRAFVDNVLATREILTPRQQRTYLGILGRLRDRGDRGGEGRGDRSGDRRRRPGEGRGGPPP
jgi:Spy/CpxP family protein refolding chaperone